jgi:hypothetical protein
MEFEGSEHTGAKIAISNKQKNLRGKSIVFTAN